MECGPFGNHHTERLFGSLPANVLATKAELFLSPVGSFFWSEQVMSWYTNLLPYDLERRLKHSSDRATTELTSLQNERTLAGQSAVRRPEGLLHYNGR